MTTRHFISEPGDMTRYRLIVSDIPGNVGWGKGSTLYTMMIGNKIEKSEVASDGMIYDNRWIDTSNARKHYDSCMFCLLVFVYNRLKNDEPITANNCPLWLDEFLTSSNLRNRVFTDYATMLREVVDDA